MTRDWKDILSKTKELYTNGFSLSKIAKELNIPKQTLDYHVSKSDLIKRNKLENSKLIRNFI